MRYPRRARHAAPSLSSIEAREMLDGLLRWASPRAALRRELARTQLSYVRRVRAYYDGARSDNRANSWRITPTDANAEARIGGARLRDIARDMVRNHAYAARGKQVIQTNLVGAGIIPSII